MAKREVDFTKPIIAGAVEVAGAVSAEALFVYADAVDDLPALKAAIKPPTKLILVCRGQQDERRAQEVEAEIVTVPALSLTRMAQIKMATLMAFSQQALRPGNVFVFLSGTRRLPAGGGSIDTLVTMRVGQEYELFQSVGQPKLTEHIRRPVFEKVLTLTLELAHEGREGRPMGALFVVGDHREVVRFCQEGRINPFKGYTEKQRNILDDSMRETVKEIAKIDGAFIIKGNGVIVSAGTILRPALAGEDLPQGLGARHAAAAAITASTKSLALSLSESTGTVRLWRRGTMITEIEKASRSVLDPHAPTA